MLCCICKQTYNAIHIHCVQSHCFSSSHQAVLLLRPLVSVTGRLKCRATALKPPQRVTAFASSPLPTPSSNSSLLVEMLHIPARSMKLTRMILYACYTCQLPVSSRWSIRGCRNASPHSAPSSSASVLLTSRTSGGCYAAALTFTVHLTAGGHAGDSAQLFTKCLTSAAALAAAGAPQARSSNLGCNTCI